MSKARENLRAKNVTKCTGCGDQEAIWILIDYDNIQLLCDSCMKEISTLEDEINLNYYSIFMGWGPIFEHINRNLKYLDEQYSSLLSKYTWLTKEIRKLEAIENLMRNKPYIKVQPHGQYSIGPPITSHMQSSEGPKLASEIMAIIFPDEEDV